MEQWYRDSHTNGVELHFKIEKNIYSVKSSIQQIDVIESKEYKRMLVIDGKLSHAEKDEFIYHEMISHVPMAVNPSIADVLIVGVGNGGVVNQLVKYKTIKSIIVLESDDTLIEVVKKYMPRCSESLSDPRVTIEICDDMKYTRSVKNQFDLIIVDIPDPFGRGENHFTKEYYGKCYTCLRENGILINQHESCFYNEHIPACQKAHINSVKVFEISKVFQASISTYPSGHWLFGFSSKKLHPINDLKVKEWQDLNISTRYYNTKLHVGAFALPTYVENILKVAE
jgi:spermidine synthase